MSATPPPLHAFRFAVAFSAPGAPTASKGSSNAPAAPGAGFSECTGLEGTMEPKVIKEGGRNFGVVQRAGPVTFATVVLKRGVFAGDPQLFSWFTTVPQGGYGLRRNVSIALRDPQQNTVLTWTLFNALPVKFKAADMNAKASEVAIEELHLAHEGLTLA